MLQSLRDKLQLKNDEYFTRSNTEREILINKEHNIRLDGCIDYKDADEREGTVLIKDPFI